MQTQQSQTIRSQTKSQTSHKVVIMGDSGVGKSELLHYIKFRRFHGGMMSTVAAMYQTLDRRTSTGAVVGLWDTAGSERMSHFLPMYIRNADLCILCFRMGDNTSIEWLRRLLNDPNVVMPQCMVVATQSDRLYATTIDAQTLHEASIIDRETSKAARQRLGLEQPVYIVSSKAGNGVGDLVEAMYAFLETHVKHRSTSDLPEFTVDDTAFKTKKTPLMQTLRSCCTIS